MKRYSLISIILVVVLIVASCPVFATQATSNQLESQLPVLEHICSEYVDENLFYDLEEAYRMLSIWCSDQGYLMDISLERFISEYNSEAINVYTQYHRQRLIERQPAIQEMFVNSVSEASTMSDDDDKWWYNTGYDLPRAADYTKYTMLEAVRTGDVVIEHRTVSSGFTGHAAIVDGRYYSNTYGMYYIRMVEAILEGVCFSIMDDSRIDAKESYFYRVTDATTANRSNAVSFARGEVGKNYALSPALSLSSSTWYCSALVWAAYMNQGINLMPGYSDGSVVYVLPYSLEKSSGLTSVTISRR